MNRPHRLLLLVTLCGLVSGPLREGSAGSASLGANEGRRPYWIFPVEPDRPLPDPSAAALSTRAVRRLAKVGHAVGSDLRDYPIDPSSLTALRERGIEIRHLSRWLRAASALLTDEEARELASDPRVASIRPVGRYVRPLDRVEVPGTAGRVPPAGAGRDDPGSTDPTSFTGGDYGGAWEQLEMLGIPELHAHGYSGRGVIVALFDTGFLKDHDALASLDLVAERDYVRGDGDVQYEPDDPFDLPQASSHGTYTWSAAAGFAPRIHLGAAYGASFVLARTEDIAQEVHLEEDNYIAALEWADSLGVDVVSTSLGYRYGFDDGDYTIDDLDGATLPITLATELAAGRGILVVTAMGNEGPDPSTLNAPADGKQVVSVGAADFHGNVVRFSSRGPTGDGRTKPDVLALGTFTHCALAGTLDAYGRVNGTSLSTPLIAGLAAVLLEADSTWTPDSVIAHLRASGDRADGPSNDHGWGVPDALRALGLETARLRVPRYVWEEAGSGDGVIGWGETGTIRVWVRNDATVPSSTTSLSLVDLDDRLDLLEGGVVELPPIAPGDSLLAGVLGTIRVARGTEVDLASFFVRYDQDGRTFERKLYVPLDEPDVLPEIASVYPNPARGGSVRIEISLRAGAQPRLEIYSVTGRRIRTLRAENGDAGAGHFLWDLEDREGRAVPTGIYFARQPGGETHRLSVVR